MHQDGLNVYLELLDGTRIQEYAHLLKPKEGDGPRVLISLPPGTPLRVVLEAHDDFRVFSSEGVKLVVACGHTKQKPWALHDVQAFYISNEDLKEKAWRIEAFDRCRGHDREDQELFDAPEEIPLTAPVPRAYEPDQVHEDWWQESFSADQGCIAIFLVRGKLDGKTNAEREKYPTDPPESYRTQDVEIRAIQWEWFSELQSKNGQPIIFEFRNVDTAVAGCLELLEDPPIAFDNGNEDDDRRVGDARKTSEIDHEAPGERGRRLLRSATRNHSMGKIDAEDDEDDQPRQIRRLRRRRKVVSEDEDEAENLHMAPAPRRRSQRLQDASSASRAVPPERTSTRTTTWRKPRRGAAPARSSRPDRNTASVKAETAAADLNDGGLDTRAYAPARAGDDYVLIQTVPSSSTGAATARHAGPTLRAPEVRTEEEVSRAGNTGAEQPRRQQRKMKIQMLQTKLELQQSELEYFESFGEPV